MGFNPINLALRFLLEILALAAMGYWGWTQHAGLPRFFWAIGLPLLAAILWGTFAVPGDRSRSGKAPVPVSGLARLLLELAIFAVATLALVASGLSSLSLIFGSVVIIHYLLSYDRVAWLIRN